MWQCASIMPGMTVLPVQSITCAPSGAQRPAPTALIFPSATSTSPAS